MPATTMAPELVTLRGGLVVSVDALRVLWDLEDRGFDVKLGDGRRLQGARRSIRSPDGRG